MVLIPKQMISLRAVGTRTGASNWSIAPLIALLAACAPEDNDFLDSVPEVRVEQDLRIDGYQADLVPVAWLGIGQDDRIAIIQLQDASIRFFSSAGEPQGDFGGPGEGPSEFRRPLRGGWIGDTLWIDDTQLNRSTLIAPDLHLVRTLPHASSLQPVEEERGRIPEFGPGTPFAVYPGDTALVAAFARAGDPLANAFDGSPLLRVSPDGAITRVVAVRPSHERGSFFVIFSDGGGAGFPVPFYQSPRWSVSPNGERIAILTVTLRDSDLSSFQIRVVDEQGNEIFDRTYRTSATAIPTAVIDSAVSARAENASNGEMRSAILRNLRGQMPLMYSPVSDILIGMDGRIWVSLRPTTEGNRWLILEPGGEPDGRVVLPRNVTLRVADDRYLWGLETDELGVESVVRYRLSE
jgi:hypothetical protein